jgi:RNA polymerase sigma factor (sigma-70 family)
VTSMPLVALLERAKTGDAIALHQLCRQLEPFLRSVARRSLGPRVRRHADSEDIAQSAMRRILAGSMRARFDDETRALAWMAAIIRNRVRSLARHPQDQGGDALDAGLDPEGPVDPATWASDAEEVVRFREELDRLGEREGHVVRLRDFEGLSWAEVASRSQCPSPEAARKLHHRAIQRIRARLVGGAGNDVA